MTGICNVCSQECEAVADAPDAESLSGNTIFLICEHEGNSIYQICDGTNKQASVVF